MASGDWRLGESIHTAANCHFQQSPSGCGCGLASAALHHSPETNRRVRGPIPQSMHRACHSANRFTRRLTRRSRMTKIGLQKRLYASIFFFFIAAVPSFLKNILSASVGVLMIELTPTVAALGNCLNQRHGVPP